MGLERGIGRKLSLTIGSLGVLDPSTESWAAGILAKKRRNSPIVIPVPQIGGNMPSLPSIPSPARLCCLHLFLRIVR